MDTVNDSWNSSNGIQEIATAQIWQDGNTKHQFRIIEYMKNGVPTRKFGISEFFYSENNKHWYPTKKHHVYLPLAAWSKLIAQDFLVARAAQPADGLVGDHIPSNASVQHCDASPTGDVNATTPRRRGRPPKRANECTVANEGPTASCVQKLASGPNQNPTTEANEKSNKERTGGIEPQVKESEVERAISINADVVV